METGKPRVLDPHEEDGLKLIFSNIITVLYQTKKSEKISKREVRLQIWTKQTEKHLEKLQIEIVDDADIFFHYFFKIEEEKYPEYKEEKELDVDFSEFLNLTRKYIDGSQNDKENYRILLRLTEKSGNIILSKKLKFKFADVFNFDLEVAPKAITRRCVQARYNQMRKELENKENDLFNQQKNVEARSPSLAGILDAMIAKVK